MTLENQITSVLNSKNKEIKVIKEITKNKYSSKAAFIICYNG